MMRAGFADSDLGWHLRERLKNQANSRHAMFRASQRLVVDFDEERIVAGRGKAARVADL